MQLGCSSHLESEEFGDIGALGIVARWWCVGVVVGGIGSDGHAQQQGLRVVLVGSILVVKHDACRVASPHVVVAVKRTIALLRLQEELIVLNIEVHLCDGSALIGGDSEFATHLKVLHTGVCAPHAVYLNSIDRREDHVTLSNLKSTDNAFGRIFPIGGSGDFQVQVVVGEVINILLCLGIDAHAHHDACQ